MLAKGTLTLLIISAATTLGACRPIDMYLAERASPPTKQADYTSEKCTHAMLVQWYPSWRVDNSNICPM